MLERVLGWEIQSILVVFASSCPWLVKSKTLSHYCHVPVASHRPYRKANGLSVCVKLFHQNTKQMLDMVTVYSYTFSTSPSSHSSFLSLSRYLSLSLSLSLSRSTSLSYTLTFPVDMRIPCNCFFAHSPPIYKPLN